MNIEQKNKLIIISSPSGAGKTTLCKLLLKKMNNVSLSISYTSRNKKLNEINGKDYKFVNKKDFLKLKKNNYFIETAKNFNHYYGSPFNNLKKASKLNKHLLFDIDWKGARKIRNKFLKNDIIDFFILPPSVKELRKRLIKRGRDNRNEIDLRLSYALDEIKHYNEYRYILINQNIHQTTKDIIKIIEYHLFLNDNKKILNKNLKKLINFK
ncbi:MAG: Guanylate kinase [Alphaproteobacteria bacterium MarineAlpha5_Bin5]|nr:MAG: Guanylate kinase [Alphaproteobacteria bacterium MarineAlpha5_Bin5]|tara:strand:- start:2191 stop:2823 length:633 start_codon:yes stop_codon:yes gene_type:complete